MRRTPVQDGQLVGAVYEPVGRARGHAVVLGGSGGGIPEPMAERVARAGLTAFGVAYFNAPGLPQSLVEVPLETVQRAVQAFSERYANGRSVGLIGSSKGSELALNAAARLGELIGPVVLAAPSSVSWYGLARSGLPSLAQPSWAWQGSAVPFLPFAGGAAPTFTPGRGLRVDGCYDSSLYPAPAVERAVVPAERAAGPLLLLAGADDHMWPAAAMAEQIAKRMHAHGRGTDTVTVIYEGAGHTFLHHDPKAPPQRNGRWDFGGDDPSDGAAFTDAWARIATFLAG